MFEQNQMSPHKGYCLVMYINMKALTQDTMSNHKMMIIRCKHEQ